MKRHSIALTVLLLFPALRGAGQGIPQIDLPQARREFLEVLTIARLPDEKQSPHIAPLYLNRFPWLLMTLSAGLPAQPEPILQRAPKQTPEAVADELEKAGGVLTLHAATKIVAIDVLFKHPILLKPLIRADLFSKDPKIEYRAIALLCERPLPDFRDRLITLYLEDKATFIRDEGRLALIRLDDPRAMERLLPLLSGDRPLPDSFPPPGGYFQLLARLSSNRPPPPPLLAALGSPKVEIRRGAAYALQNSRDDRLVPYVRRLIKDPDPQIRQYAARMGTELKPKAWEQVRPDVLTLLSDTDHGVRAMAALILIPREGKNVARPLLELVRDTTLEKRFHFYVTAAINQLTGEDFGYDTSYYQQPERWEPTTPENRAAIERYAHWVETHVPPQKTP